MYKIRPILLDENAAMAKIIREVMIEYHCEGDEYSINDPDVDQLFEYYTEKDRSVYYVIQDTEKLKLIGGAGIGPLAGMDGTICELRKMYILPEGRGHGLGRRLLEKCIEAARTYGYRQVYLETITEMKSAGILYRKLGFKPLPAQIGATGHSGCTEYLLLDL